MKVENNKTILLGTQDWEQPKDSFALLTYLLLGVTTKITKELPTIISFEEEMEGLQLCNDLG